MENNTETVQISIDRYDELTKKEQALETISVLIKSYYINNMDNYGVKSVLLDVIATVERKDNF